MKNPDGNFFTKLLGLAAFAALIYGGWWGYKRFFVGAQQAVLDSVLINTDGNIAQVDMTFNAYPGSGDAKDVRLTLSSKALANTVVWDWSRIASKDNSAQTTPEQRPPLNVRLRVRVPIELRSSFKGDTSDALLHAKLEWAGAQQDKGKGTLWDRYHKR